MMNEPLTCISRGLQHFVLRMNLVLLLLVFNSCCCLVLTRAFLRSFPSGDGVTVCYNPELPEPLSVHTVWTYSTEPSKGLGHAKITDMISCLVFGLFVKDMSTVYAVKLVNGCIIINS